MMAVLRFAAFAALALCCAGPAKAQFNPPAQLSAQPTAAGGTPNPYALLTHQHCTASAAGCTTGAISGTGGKLIVVNIFQYSLAGATVTPSDSSSNSYTAGTCQNGTGSPVAYSCLYYSISPTVTGSMTFTCAPPSGNMFGGCEVAIFSRTGVAPVFDTQNGAYNTSATATTLAAGSITPAGTSELFVTGMSAGDDSTCPTYSVNNSYTVTDFDCWVSGFSEGGGLAYLLPTNSSAQNPTWTASSSSNTMAATHMAFK